MSLKKMLLVALLAVVLAPAAAMADTLDILFAGGTWSWAGGTNPLFASSTTVQLARLDGVGNPAPIINPNPLAIALPISIATGPGVGGFLWAPGGGIVLGGCGGPCMVGSFTSFQVGFNAGTFTIVAGFIAAVVDPGVLAYFELPTDITNVIGSLHFDIIGAINPETGGAGALGSGDINVGQVPEPGTLAMFGSGLIGMAGLLRRKLNI